MPLTGSRFTIDNMRAAPAGESRSDTRHLTPLRIARIHAGGADDLCLIRNISELGMMIETGHPLVRGQKVIIEIRSDRLIAGTVRWIRPGGAGIELDTPIDVGETLGGAIAPNTAQHPRAPRFARSGVAMIDAASGSAIAPIINVSLSGLCIQASANFRRFERAIVRIEGLCDTAAQIRWVGDAATGLQFDHRLSFRRLQKWLAGADGSNMKSGVRS